MFRFFALEVITFTPVHSSIEMAQGMMGGMGGAGGMPDFGSLMRSMGGIGGGLPGFGGGR